MNYAQTFSIKAGCDDLVSSVLVAMCRSISFNDLNNCLAPCPHACLSPMNCKPCSWQETGQLLEFISSITFQTTVNRTRKLNSITTHSNHTFSSYITQLYVFCTKKQQTTGQLFAWFFTNQSVFINKFLAINKFLRCSDSFCYFSEGKVCFSSNTYTHLCLALAEKYLAKKAQVHIL